jgi:hypothetical protein
MTKLTLKAIAAFLIFAPFVTFILFVLKGLPAFASGHELDVLSYVYRATWIPALVSGILFSCILQAVRPRLAFFTQP